MACKIIWEEHGILFRHTGTVTDQEVLMMNNIMYGDVRFEKISYQISDYSGVTNNRITSSDAKVIGTLDRTSSHWNSKKMRVAVVTHDEKFVPVVKSYFREFAGTRWEGRIFETLEKAQEWVRSR